MTTVLAWPLALALTLISGYGDSRGFIYASRIWQVGSLSPSDLLKSALGYSFGIVAYWLALRFVLMIKAISPEAQALGWFVVAIVGVAASSGDFLRWDLADKCVGVVVVVGLGFILVRTGA